MKNETYTLNPIGYVRSSNCQTTIEVEESYRSALKGLEGFSHLQIIFWCHLVDNDKDRNIMTCEKPYTKGPDEIGIFATRSPLRPNPIAITPVIAIKVDAEKGLIHMPFIDAENDTPILDIKPYTPSIDRIKTCTTPKWCEHWPRWYEDSATFDWQAEFNF